MKTRTLATLASLTLTLTLSAIPSSAADPSNAALDPAGQQEAGMIESLAATAASIAAAAVNPIAPVLHPRVLAAQASRYQMSSSLRPRVLAAQASRHQTSTVLRPRVLAAQQSRQAGGS